MRIYISIYIYIYESYSIEKGNFLIKITFYYQSFSFFFLNIKYALLGFDLNQKLFPSSKNICLSLFKMTPNKTKFFRFQQKSLINLLIAEKNKLCEIYKECMMVVCFMSIALQDLFNTPQKQQLYGYLPPITKTIQVRRPRHAGHCWRNKEELISDILLWTLSHERAKAGRPARTYIQHLCEDTGCSLEDLLPVAMDDREEWRERVWEIRAEGAT